MLDDDVEELPEDNKRLVGGFGVEEVRCPRRLNEDRVEEVPEARQREALSSSFMNAGVGWRRLSDARGGTPRRIPGGRRRRRRR